MGEQERPTTVTLPAGICRRCVRVLSRRISDVPGVLSLEYDADAGVLRIGGEPDLAAPKVVDAMLA
ncbi:heavy-metal-associated domain-containing protein, partial [Micromonospora yasonensis]|uniref:heavy-metal-associated domain-containing protein n=1 Tax=Micromonospora yasonensis TaxID=1128667 RepID=UPI00223096B0